MKEAMCDRGGRVPTFDGEKANFPTWLKKFLAYALMIKIKSVWKEVRDPHLLEKEISEIDETTEQGKLARIAVSKNDMAMVSFTMAFSNDNVMNIIYVACTPEWPEGQAHLVVKELMKRYRPLDTVSKIEMRQQLSKIKMRKGSNPSILFESLTTNSESISWLRK